MTNFVEGESRRTFLKKAGAAAAACASVDLAGLVADPVPSQPTRDSSPAWYCRTLRWGQTNITELDPARYDVGWWRQYWRRTQVQGVILNAGGIVAYYPSKFSL